MNPIDSINVGMAGVAALPAIAVGLVVWLVKHYEKRAEAITTRYFEHLERSGERAGEVHAAYQLSIREMGGEIKQLAGAVGHQTRTLDQLVATIKQHPCGQGVSE